MTVTEPGVLQSLTSFTVTADYHRHETGFGIWPPNRRAPAARLHKDGPVLNLELAFGASLAHGTDQNEPLSGRRG
jgi:hypothetical protein